jgi:hypothetical protein
MTGEPNRKNEGLSNASVSTSRGGGHDGETDGSTPSNLGLPGDDQQKGLDVVEGRKRAGSQVKPSGARDATGESAPPG